MRTENFLLLLLAMTLVACSMGARDLPSVTPEASLAPERTPSANSLQQHFEALQKLSESTPVQQQEILNAAQLEADNTRLAGARLRLALLLGTPGHAGYNVIAASQILNDILKVPETLPPLERTLARIEAARIREDTARQVEARQLRDELERVERERINPLARRLQTETEETAKLRKALEEARAKLDAISNIERVTTGRSKDQPPP
jgi:DNA repair exonuclease SbcCD ATPase subunit